ncbi:CotO family spore coat protein [Paraliobacillus sp. JSM ZJ581]|uniref:CotO family spore coat protein n=1 Tax=Paraliobacillus sp. JSM ZJ581 TaxID=3342118 RepID=UPI0035A833F2
MSRKKRNARRRPMLYIDQPDLEAPTPNMQEDYHSPKHQKISATNTSQSIKRPKSRKKTKMNEMTEVDKLDIDDNDTKETENIENDLTEEPKEKDEVNKEADEEENEKNEEIEVRTASQLQDKVPFTEMSLIEQVDYLAASPGFMPKLKCEVITENERLKGIIRERKEETVYVETFKRPRYHQVLLGDITSIRLLGF